MNANLKTATVISISMDGIWAGSGNLVDGEIQNCGAQFCRDNDESIRIYDRIEAAIAVGKKDISVDLDGERHVITWTITDGDG